MFYMEFLLYIVVLVYMCSLQKVLICDVACFLDGMITLAVKSIDISNLQNYIITKKYSRVITKYFIEILWALHDLLEYCEKYSLSCLTQNKIKHYTMSTKCNTIYTIDETNNYSIHQYGIYHQIMSLCIEKW